MSQSSTNVVALPVKEPRRLTTGRREPVIPNNVFGMMIFIVTEVMFFAGLVSAYTIAAGRNSDLAWPPLNQPRLPIEETALNTVALLLSGVLLFFAARRFKVDPQRARWLFGASILLGAFFVVFQGVEWVALISQGLALTFSTHASFFYLIVGTHALHAVASLLALGWACRRLWANRLAASSFWTVRLFWYFVVSVWPVLYVLVYL